MSRKKFNYQCCYLVDSEYPYTAFNLDGTLNGFMHPPIRDFEQGVWQDSVDGSYGFFIPYDDWDKWVRETSALKDLSKINVNELTRAKREREKKDGNSLNA